MPTNRSSNLALGAVVGTVLAAAALASAQSTTIVRQVSDNQDSAIHVTVNDQPIAFQGLGPVMVDGTVMVPVRGIFEQMGGDVQWMPKAKVVEGSRPGHMFRLRLGSDQAMVDGNMHNLSSPAQLINDTTYIPLRFASEALGAHVDWEGSDHTVTITTTGPTTIIKKTTTTTTTTPGQ